MRMLMTAASIAALALGTAPARAQQTVVDWWGWAPAQDIAQGYIAKFREAHPEIDLRYRYISYPDYTQALRLGLASNAGPDVFDLQPGVLTSQFGQFAADLSGLAETTLGPDWASDLSPIGVQSFTVDGALKALPVVLGGAGQIWYNRDLFERVGVEPPTTLAEWEAACTAFAAADVTCFVQGAKDAWVNTDTLISIAQSIAPGKVVDAVEGRVDWTDADLVEAFRVWGGLFENGIMQEGALGVAQYPDANNAWVDGQAAMIMMGTWHAGMMSKALLNSAQESGGFTAADFVALPMPFPAVGNAGAPLSLFGGADYGLAVNSASDASEAAETVVAFFALDPAGAGLVAQSGFPSALNGVPLVISDLVDEAAQSAALEAMSADIAAMTTPREIPYPELRDTLGDALASVAAGTMTPEEAAAALQGVSASVERP